MLDWQAAKKRLGRLSWWILQAKYKYYIKNGQDCVPDWLYDYYEKEYEHWCRQFNVAPTASDMVGFDESRPSCQMVMEWPCYLKMDDEDYLLKNKHIVFERLRKGANQ